MRKPKICKKLLEIILEIEIDHIEYPDTQKTIDLALDPRSVRLDVYVKDGKGTVYNVEMQTSDTKELPKRSRYYQGIIDLNLIEKGAHFKELSTSFVIFICTFDLFGRGRHKYTFQNRCEEEKDLVLGDETTKIFLNSDSVMDDVSKELQMFLDYVNGNRVEGDDFVEKLVEEVEHVKNNEEWRREYMTLYLRDQENIAKGKAEGEAKGEAKERRKIIQSMLKNGLTIEQIIKICDVTKEEIEELMVQSGVTDKAKGF